jgi:hypothetical protein
MKSFYLGDLALLVIVDVKPLPEVQLAFLPKDVNDAKCGIA